ncbi:unnamed protein product, partial [Coregonus sp. 'balchen']
MDIQHRQRPIKPDQSFWDNRRLWTARIFSMLCCVLVVSVVAVFCAFVYLILKELRTERVIGEDGSEVRLLGFWSVLVMSVLAGVCCCSFTWTITYFDSFEPGTFPPTPLVAVLNGIVAAITDVEDLPALIRSAAGPSVLGDDLHRAQDGSSVLPLKRGTTHHHYRSLGLRQHLEEEREKERRTGKVCGGRGYLAEGVCSVSDVLQHLSRLSQVVPQCRGRPPPPPCHPDSPSPSVREDLLPHPDTLTHPAP